MALHNYPNRLFCSNAEACEWVASFVAWYNLCHSHSGFNFVMPLQWYSGTAPAISLKQAHVYDYARQKHPLCWSRSNRCWHQQEVVWINKPPEDQDSTLAIPLIQAA